MEIYICRRIGKISKMGRFKPNRLLWIHLFYLAMGILLCSGQGWADQQSLDPAIQEDVLELSLEDLLDIEVTSVSKKAQSLSDTAAAIFVITNDDLRRSGVTNIPDALRMVPGLNVARIDSNKWAVTSRGFNSRFANKLLVLIDGRSVYTPTFSGVYWEVQDVLLEDIERIEVIRGPGATLWGSNAVNGVINIITKHAADTQGGLMTLGAGTEERGFGAVRYGVVLGEGTYGRVYAKGFKRDEFIDSAGDNAGDEWDVLRSGFRVDSWLSDRNALTVQGDVYKGNISQTLELPTLTAPFSQTIKDKVDISGRNLVARWHHVLSPTSECTLQLYYDMSDRDEAFEREVRDTFDIDLQHRFALGEQHDIIWGLGYRYTSDDFTNSSMLSIDPDNSNEDLFSAFVQDEVTFMDDRLWLTLGLKLEHNDYTGFEIQPNVRLFWAANPLHKLWAAISRAVRTPSRSEHDLRVLNTVLQPFSADNPSHIPIAVTVLGDSDYHSEELLAYELGYRIVPARSLSMDLTAFYNDYDDLRSVQFCERSFQAEYLDQPLDQRLKFNNEIKGKTYGIELASVWQAAEWLRYDLAYSHLRIRMDSRDEIDKLQYNDGPLHQVSLRSAVNFGKNLDLNLCLRYVDVVSAINGRRMSRFDIDGYFTFDVCLAWRPSDNVELSLAGHNLADGEYLEYVQDNFTLPTQIERSVYGKLTWRF